MSWLDWAMVAILLFTALQGAQRGWPRAALGILGILLGVWAALRWGGPLGTGVTQVYPPAAPWAFPTAFLLLVAAGDTIVGLLGGLFLRPPRSLPLVHRSVAAILGLLKGVVVVGVFLSVLLGSPLEPLVAKDVKRSRLTPVVIKGEQWAMRTIGELSRR